MSYIDPKVTPPPKDGTMILLLVKRIEGDDNWHPTEDAEVFRTMGYNGLEDTEEDEWFIVGWDWCQDCFVNSSGEIIGWMPMPSFPPGVEP